LKLVELAIVMVLDNVEDEKTFSIFNFMKSKLHNHLTTHLSLMVRMHVYKFYKVETFLFYTINLKNPLTKVLKYEKFELPSVASFRNLRLIRIDYWHVFHLNKKKSCCNWKCSTWLIIWPWGLVENILL